MNNNGLLGQNFHHLHTFVKERSHNVSPYYSDSAIDSVAASNNTMSHGRRNRLQMPSNGNNFFHEMVNPIPKLISTPASRYSQQQTRMHHCLRMNNNSLQAQHQMHPSFIATTDTPVRNHPSQMNEVLDRQQPCQNFKEPQVP